jgi:hypothetical protein
MLIFSICEHMGRLINQPNVRARFTLHLLENAKTIIDVQIIIIEVAIFLLQLVVAVVGGLLVSWVVKRWGARAPCLRSRFRTLSSGCSYRQ